MWLQYDCFQDIRYIGCASLDLGWVVSRRMDVFVELSLQRWDYAGQLLVEMVVGKVMATDGALLSLTEGEAVFSNGFLHAALMDVLNR